MSSLLSVALKLLLRKIDRTAIMILILVPVVAMLVGSNVLIGAYSTEAQSVINSVNPGGVYVANGPLNYSTFVMINKSHIEWAVPYLNVPATINGKTNTTILGTNISTLISVKHSQLIGRSATDAAQVDAGAILAGVLRLKIGDNLTIQAFSTNHTFEIVGILNSSDPTDTQLIMPLSVVWGSWPKTNDSLSYVEFRTAQGFPPPDGITVSDASSLKLVASSFSSDIASLISTWTFVLLFLAAVVGIAASQRVISGTVLEYDVLRIIGAKLSTARKLIFYEFLIIAGVAVIIGASFGIVAVDVMLTFLSAFFHTPIFLSPNLGQLLLLCGSSFLLILFVGSIMTLRIHEPSAY